MNYPIPKAKIVDTIEVVEDYKNELSSKGGMLEEYPLDEPQFNPLDRIILVDIPPFIHPSKVTNTDP